MNNLDEKENRERETLMRLTLMHLKKLPTKYLNFVYYFVRGLSQ